MQKHFNEDIGDSNFCIIVDEVRDESKREQMTLILKFVDKDDFIRERFFEFAQVKNTSPLTLKNEICIILSYHNLDAQNIRGQNYHGVSNTREEWKGSQALSL